MYLRAMLTRYGHGRQYHGTWRECGRLRERPYARVTVLSVSVTA